MIKKISEYWIDNYMEFLHEDTWCGKVTIKKPVHPLDSSVGLWNLEIFEKYRGTGLGKLMVKETVEYIINEMKITDIYLFVSYQNRRAIHVYESCGFVYAESDRPYHMKMVYKLQ